MEKMTLNFGHELPKESFLMMIGKHLLGESTVRLEEPSIISPLCSMMNTYRPSDSNSSVKKKVCFRSEKLSGSVDYPMSLYWQDLARMYPNAKVGVYQMSSSRLVIGQLT